MRDRSCDLNLNARRAGYFPTRITVTETVTRRLRGQTERVVSLLTYSCIQLLAYIGDSRLCHKELGYDAGGTILRFSKQFRLHVVPLPIQKNPMRKGDAISHPTSVHPFAVNYYIDQRSFRY